MVSMSLQKPSTRVTEQALKNLTDGETGGFTGVGLFYKNHGIKWAGGVSMVTLGAK